MPAPLPDLGPTLSKSPNSLRSKRGLIEAPDLTLERPAPAASAAHAHVLQVVQPGLLGLMDGSVSTLAPLFATAALTGRTESAFLVGLAASVGAGISMGLAEALSDDGQISGRGKPFMRGVITGGGTVIGGMLHTLPFLLTNLRTALLLAYAVVVFELLSIAYIRYRWMNSALGKTVVQVIVGGGIVFGLGIWLGKIGAGG
jgi:VIT1/CCC1 family predicted Fe2+/Mn2+ transporter